MSSKQPLYISLLAKNITSTTNGDGNKVISGLNKSLSENELKELPNHLKGLIVGSSGKDVTVKDIVPSITEDSEQKITNDIQEKIDFNLLVKIEYLFDYEKDRDGNLLINNPIWKLLSREKYEEMIGQEILCKLSYYENDKIDYKKEDILSIPFYDEYFILIPSISRKESKPALVNDGDLIGRIINRVFSSFTGITFLETTRKGKTDNKIPSRVLLSQLNSDGTENQIEVSVLDVLKTFEPIKSDVLINNEVKPMLIPIENVIPFATMDCQSLEILNEFVTTNSVNNVPLVEHLNDIAINENIPLAQEIRTMDFGKFSKNDSILSGDKK